jgi:hypothetical protein
MPVTATHERRHCTCLGNLGGHNTVRIVSISCRNAQGGFHAHRDCSKVLSLWSRVAIAAGLALTNFSNVNDPIGKKSFMALTAVREN